MALAIVVVVVLIIVWAIGIYNGLVSQRNKVKNAWSQIDVQLQRRFDLIPNLVETVKGYMEHEKGVLEKVTELRTSWANATTVSEKAELDNQLSGALKTIMAVSENYPDLRANQNFSELQEELKNTENKVAYSRQFYNDTVTNFNTKIEIFPNNIFANMFHFTAFEFFKVDQEEAKENVKVWKLKSIDSYGGSYLGVTFEETEEQSNDKVDFALTCDKDKINYKEKTICHLNAKNYMITGDTISIELNEKDDLELLRLIPTEYFSVENGNNVIKINPKYISTERGNFELLSFEVRAKNEKNEIDNISISNISYYNGETYTNLKTTINIENRTFLTSNPLTANPTLFKVLLVSAFLIACTTLVLKRESV